MITIYYDDEPELGINAYFDWGHEYFRSMSEFQSFLQCNYSDYQLVEITTDNYQELLAMGVFNGIE